MVDIEKHLINNGCTYLVWLLSTCFFNLLFRFPILLERYSAVSMKTNLSVLLRSGALHHATQNQDKVLKTVNQRTKQQILLIKAQVNQLLNNWLNIYVLN